MATVKTTYIRNLKKVGSIADLTASNYVAVDTPNGTKKVPGNVFYFLIEYSSVTIGGETVQLIDQINSKHLLAALANYASNAQSGSLLETQLSQKELSSNKKQSIDTESETDYPSSKAMAQFVNSSISLAAADYISDNGEPFQSVQALNNYAGTVTNNDYAFVTGTDSDGNTYYDRYKATVSGSTVTWAKEFRLNNSSFTSAQWNAINSNITATLVTNYNNHLENNDIHVTTSDKNSWNAKYDKPSGGIPSTDLSSTVQTSLGKADTSVQPTDVQKDSVPTKNSNNLLSSGTIYDQLQVWSQAINDLKQSLDNLAALTTFSNLTVDNLQLSSMFKIGSSNFVTVGTATPVGNVETEFFGQIYIDSTNKVGYIAVAEGGNTSAYWKQITA